MKRYQPIIVTLGFLFIAGIYILSNSSYWRKPIESYINSKLAVKAEWTVQIPNLEGNVLGSVSGDGIEITHKNGTKVNFGQFEFKLDLISSLINEPSLSLLSVRDFYVSPVIDYDSLKIKRNKNDSIGIDINATFDFSIQELVLDGAIYLPQPYDSIYIKINLDSRLEVKSEKKEFFINKFTAALNDTGGFILLKETALTLLEKSAHFSKAKGLINGLPFSGDIDYDWEIKPDVRGDIYIEEYSFPEEIFTNSPFKPKFSSLETFISFESDFKRTHGVLTLLNPLGLDMEGELSITRHKNYFSLNRLSLESEESTLSISGIYEYSGRINGNMLLTNFDLSKWMKEQDKTNVNGTIMVEGSMGNKKVDDIVVTMEINETDLYDNREMSISGTFSYSEDLFSVDTPLTIAVGPSAVTLKGSSDFKNKIVNMDLKLKDASVFLINNFWTDSLNSGYASGDLHVNGLMKNPSIKAELECRNIEYHNAKLDQITFHANWEPEDNGGRGFLRGKIDRGSWRKYNFDDGFIDISYSKDGIEIQSAEFKEGNNFLQISGLLTPDSLLVMDRIQIAFEDHYFINAIPFQVQFGRKKIEILPFELHVDDGISSGFLTFDDQIRGHIELSNVNADIVKLFTDDPKYQFSGMTFGEVTVRDKDGNVEFLVDVKLKNGIAARQKFSELIIAGSIYKSMLNVKEISLYLNEQKHIYITGFVPVGKIENGERELDFNVILNELDMSLITQYISMPKEITGVISGGYHLGGNPKQTQFDFDLSIENTVWDKLNLGEVKAEGLYDSKRIYFNKFSSNYKGSEVKGAGYLPLDYNMKSESRGEYLLDDSLWVIVDGNLVNMDFLTTYISNVDSIVGDFEIGLELNGPRNNLRRDGYLTGREATIYSTQLDDPIYNVNGKAELVDNQFFWTHLTGILVKNYTPYKKENITVTGSMDMTQFFKPNYNLFVKGNELQFRTLLGDIEGKCNIDLTIIGRDTIEIAGEIEPIDAIMYQEFSSSSDVSVTSGESSSIIHYKLNFPLTGNFALRNSQIDAHLSGELSMTKEGENPSDFGGELYVRGGKFYYYGDELTISEGYMAFDKKGFNPYLDISAFTKVSDEQIFIQLIGRLDDPQLKLESSSNFSESDIIELLTIGSRFDDTEFNVKGFGDPMKNAVGVFLDRQFEKNILQMTGLEKVVDDISISGTTGFINPNSKENFTLSAERKISDNVSLNYSYQRSFSLSNPNMNKVGVEITINEYISLVGNVDESGKWHAKYRLKLSY